MKKKSFLQGSYLAKNPVFVAFLFIFDFLSWPLKRKAQENDSPPRKILLSNLGHLGDVAIATSVLPVLKAAFPKSEIGFLVSSYSSEVVKNHPLIDKVHFFDHWKNSREKISLWQKFKKARTMKKLVLKEIRKEKYDLAIDLYFYYPNSLPLLWKAKIPKRVGFISGGFQYLLTDRTVFENKDQYVSQYYLELLRKVPVSSAFFHLLKVSLPAIDPIAFEQPNILPTEFLEKGYIVLHMGAGSHLKKWPEDKWKKLAGLLVDRGFLLVFTGKGMKEKVAAFSITKNLSQAANLCDRLSFQQMQIVVKKAAAIVCTDSLVAHLAGAYQVPAVILFTGMNNYYHWTPGGSLIHPLVKRFDCFPCFQRKGCSSMRCLHEISVDEAAESLEKVLQKAREKKKKLLSPVPFA